MFKNQKILVVDDQNLVRNLIVNLLVKEQYEVEQVTSGKEALEKIEEYSYDLIITDIMMPEMDGYELCQKVKENENHKTVPIIIITSKNSVEDLSKAFEVGANDYIIKPFNSKELILRVKNNLQIQYLQKELQIKNKCLEKDLETATNYMKNRMLRSILTLSKAIDAKDHYTSGHCDRVFEYSAVLARKINLSKKNIENLKIGAIIHDIGKIGIPDTVLNKPGKLTEEEFDLIKTHPKVGADIIKPLGLDSSIIDMILHHHEMWDGKGYPDGQKGEDILIETRILSLADVYDALRSKRPYRDTLPFEKTKSIILDWRDAHFDPVLVDLFFEHIQEIHKIETKYKII